MFEDTDSFIKARANLIIISLAIILYILGDGNFNKKGSFLGGSITFGNDNALPIAGIALFFYFLWRWKWCIKICLWPIV